MVTAGVHVDDVGQPVDRARVRRAVVLPLPSSPNTFPPQLYGVPGGDAAVAAVVGTPSIAMTSCK